MNADEWNLLIPRLGKDIRESFDATTDSLGTLIILLKDPGKVSDSAIQTVFMKFKNNYYNLHRFSDLINGISGLSYSLNKVFAQAINSSFEHEIGLPNNPSEWVSILKNIASAKNRNPPLQDWEINKLSDAEVTRYKNTTQGQAFLENLKRWKQDFSKYGGVVGNIAESSSRGIKDKKTLTCRSLGIKP